MLIWANQKFLLNFLATKKFLLKTSLTTKIFYVLF